MTDAALDVPALDCHAHIAPDVTFAQMRALGHAHIMAVTRSLAEAEQVKHRHDERLTWGIGVHPGVAGARKTYEPSVFQRLLPHFGLIGEVGLDARGGDLPRQREIFRSILDLCADEPVLLSVHSSGATRQVIDMITERPHPGLILHWFLGSHDEIDAAFALGAYFSINSAMSVETLAALPMDRILPETDFPTRKVAARRPGDTSDLEQRLAVAWKITPQAVRHRLWTNLRRVATRAEALDRLPSPLADLLLDL